jgi:hypothetical protein
MKEWKGSACRINLCRTVGLRSGQPGSKLSRARHATRPVTFRMQTSWPTENSTRVLLHWRYATFESDRAGSGKRAAVLRQQCRRRPALECPEERWLLSGGYAQLNLASDVPGLARITDSNLVNPWGISFSPTGPFWFADNGSGVSDLLDGRWEKRPKRAVLSRSTRSVKINGVSWTLPVPGDAYTGRGLAHIMLGTTAKPLRTRRQPSTENPLLLR